MRRFLLTAFSALALALAGPVAASAQQPVDHSADARVHLGPLAVNPTVSLDNLGVDTNVFNSVDDPQRDFTASLTPQADLWLHMGRGLLSGHVSVGLVYFQKFASERSVNTDDQIRFDLPLNRFRPYAIEAYTNARQRPNFEIDARSRYQINSTTVGVDLGIFGVTTVGVYGRWDKTRFSQDAQFFGSSLSESLNRLDTIAGAKITHELTPFTTVILTAEGERDRFQFATEKNSDSVRGTIGVELDPAALISGSANIGYRKFDPLGGAVPGFRGLTGQANVKYVLLGRTKFGLQFQRDVDYSFRINSPYYILTGITASVTEQLVGPFDVVARVGHQNLAYHELTGAVGLAARVDTYRTVGGGIGYRLSPDVHIGFNLDDYHRTSPLLTHGFDGLRFGLSATYGTQQ